MKFNMKLPLGVILAVFLLLALITFIWLQVKQEIDKDIIKYLCVVFVGSVIFAENMMRRGKFEIYKNILNAIWNIETAFVFIYAIYYFIEHPLTPKEVNPFYDWSLDNPKIFSGLVTALGIVCISRAGCSLVEVFKNSLARKHSSEKLRPQENKPSKKEKDTQKTN